MYQGLLERDTALVMNISGWQGDTVDVLVENMGRVNFGNKINDHKVTKERLRLSESSDCERVGFLFSLAIAHSSVLGLKGLVSNLILGKDLLTDWEIYPLNIDGVISGGWPHSDSQRLCHPRNEASGGPVFYTGTLQPNGLAWDTFLLLREWTKVVTEKTMDLFD